MLNYFNPNTMEDNQNKPTIIIENFTKGDSLFILHKSDTTTERHNVYYYEKDLSFFISFLFITCMLLLIISLIFFVLEVFISTRSIHRRLIDSESVLASKTKP